MTATIKDIQEWLEEAKEQKASHLIIVWDTFSHENYPIYAFGKKNCREKVKEYDKKNMQIIDEIYNMKRSIKNQLAEEKAWHF